MPNIAIGKLAVIAATKVQTIRYYEQIDLIRPFKRSEGGHRIYGPEDVQRLKFVRHARELGFGIGEIRELLQLSDNPGDGQLLGACPRRTAKSANPTPVWCGKLRLCNEREFSRHK